MMRLLALLACVVALVMGPARTAAARAKPRVAYLGSVTKNVDTETQDAVDTSAVAGIQATPAVYVGLGGEATSHPGQAPCATPSCLTAVKQKSGAEYFILADVRGTNSGADHAVTVQLIRAEPYDVAFFENFTCEGCIPAKLGERTETNVSLLISHLIESLDNTPVIRPGGGTPGLVALPERPGPVPTWLPWTGIGVTVAAVGAGIWLLHLDNQWTCGTPSPPQKACPERYDTGRFGYAAFAGAALAAAGTGYLFYRNTRGESAAVAYTGDGVALFGTF